MSSPGSVLSSPGFSNFVAGFNNLRVVGGGLLFWIVV